MSFERGVAAEHSAIAKLMHAGRKIAQPLNTQEKYDLLLWGWQTVRVGADDYAHLQAWCRVQVKRAYLVGNKYRVDLRAWSGRKNRTLYGPTDLEYLCVVTDEGVYLIPWHVVRDKQSFTMTDKLKRYIVTGESFDVDEDQGWRGPTWG